MKNFHRLKDSDVQGTVFITSDPHFQHNNILKHANRPFKTIIEHDNALIANWNKVVGDGDTVICLGDFSLTSHMKAKKICEKLNGRKILVRGNHDRSHDVMKQIGFYISVPNLIYMDYYMVHDPNKIGKNLFKNWKNAPSIVLAGHTHLKDRVIYRKNRTIINMSADAWEFTPVKLVGLWQQLL